MRGAILADKEWRDRVYRYLLQLFIVLYVALQRDFTNAVLLFLGIFWLTEPGLVKKLKNSLRDPLVLSLLSLFVIHLVGMIYTSDLHEGWNKLQARSALVVYPLLFSTVNISDKTFRTLLRTFIVACTGLGFIGLTNSAWLYFQTHQSVYLYSDNLLILIDGQAIYFALYLNVAILFLFYLSMQPESAPWERNLYHFIILPFFLFLIFLLASRLSLVIIVLMGLGTAAYYVINGRKWRLGVVIVAGMVLGGFLLAHLFPKTINRFKSLSEFHFDYKDDRGVYHFNETDYKDRWNGLTIRLAIWSCTWKAIEAHPWIGAGTGDYMNELRKVYKERDFKLGMENDYSTHDQFLQIWLTLGLVGLLIFLYSLLYPARSAWLQGNYIYVLFLGMVVLNMLTEEILIVYRGVLFFGFFNSLLLLHLHRRRQALSQKSNYPKGTS